MKKIDSVWAWIMAVALVTMSLPSSLSAQTPAQRRAHAANIERVMGEVMTSVAPEIDRIVAGSALSEADKPAVTAQITESARADAARILNAVPVGRNLPEASTVSEQVMSGLQFTAQDHINQAIARAEHAAALASETAARAQADEEAARLAEARHRGNVVHVPHDVPTISEAMTLVRMGDTVRVAPGTYKERIVMTSGVALISDELFGARLNGGGRGTVVTMARNGTIAGFEITNGTIGIFSGDIGNTIANNRIVKNWMTGIIVVRQLPQIEDNIIAFNRASGIQGWDVRTTAASINHNSIAFNGNHGIAIGGSSEVIIENNILAFNEKFGIKILREPERIQVSSNNFYRNMMQTGWPIPEGNYVFDPAFIGARSDMNFNPDPGLCCKEKSSEGENLGARLMY